MEDLSLAVLRRDVRRLKLAVLGLALFGAAAVTVAATRGPETIRARGIVIIDDQGRDRILLGAPAPASAQRRRTDAATSSLVFLGPDGSDRVVVGQTPDPWVGGKAYKRVSDAWGLVIHDPKGDERGGMAFLDSGRASIALDYAGQDAIGMMVDDKTARAGLLLNYPPGAGAEDSAAALMVRDGEAGLTLRDPKGLVRARLPAR